MEPHLLCTGFRRAVVCNYNPAKRRILFHSRRGYATPTETSSGSQEPVRAAPPIRFSSNANQFAVNRAEFVDDAEHSVGSRPGQSSRIPLLERIRILPASPSYFTGTPRFTDDFLALRALERKYQLLPTLPLAEAPRVAWKTLEQYRTELGEPVRLKRYSSLLTLLKKLNSIHPSLFPVEVERALARYKRVVQPHLNQPKAIVVDELGRARAVGRRKACHAEVYLVEGEGQCLINGKTLTEYFGRLHDRESAMWPLKATARLDKYNVWSTVRGGGTTGQAEAITLGLAKALLVHEPALKPALRKGACRPLLICLVEHVC